MMKRDHDVTIEGGVRVLIVDDDRGIRQTLHAALADEGYSLFEAADGAEALCILRRTPYHLVVLLDLRMPGLDGAGVLEAVASEPRLVARHTFILITANEAAITPTCAALLRRLDVPIVPKPFDLDSLIDMVDQAASGLLATVTDPALRARDAVR